MRRLFKEFGKDDFGFECFPRKISGTRISRQQVGHIMGGARFFPHGFETKNSRRSKIQRSWKKHRAHQWKEDYGDFKELFAESNKKCFF